MTTEDIHYWSGTAATFKAVRAAAARAGQIVAVWVGEAVLQRLERERESRP